MQYMTKQINEGFGIKLSKLILRQYLLISWQNRKWVSHVLTSNNCCYFCQQICRRAVSVRSSTLLANIFKKISRLFRSQIYGALLYFSLYSMLRYFSKWIISKYSNQNSNLNHDNFIYVLTLMKEPPRSRDFEEQ